MVDEGARTGKTLGGALFEWRTRSGLSLGEVSKMTGAPITRLVGIESDKLGPSADLLTKLATVYADDLHGCREEAGWDAVLSWLQAFAQFESPNNREMLKLVAASIRRMRKLPETGLVIMRDQEIDIIFSALDIQDEQLPSDVAEIFSLEPFDAAALVERSILRQRRSEASTRPLIDRIHSTIGLASNQASGGLDWDDPAIVTESRRSAA